MKIPPIFKDKRAQVAIAGAGVLGLVVLARRKNSGATKSGATIQPATVDSSGTDAWNAIQDVQQGWANQLGDFSKQLKDIQDQLGKPPVTDPGVHILPYPFPGKPLPTPAPKKPAPTKVSVPRNTDLYGWVKQLQTAYNPKLTFAEFRRLNPGIDKKITWKSNGPGKPKTPMFSGPTGPVNIR